MPSAGTQSNMRSRRHQVLPMMTWGSGRGMSAGHGAGCGVALIVNGHGELPTGGHAVCPVVATGIAR
jgi:hypothetical protein